MLTNISSIAHAANYSVKCTCTIILQDSSPIQLYTFEILGQKLRLVLGHRINTNCAIWRKVNNNFFLQMSALLLNVNFFFYLSELRFTMIYCVARHRIHQLRYLTSKVHQSLTTQMPPGSKLDDPISGIIHI